jgi:hypothetical protein
MLKNIDTDLDRQGVTRLVINDTVIITEEVAVGAKPDPNRSEFLSKTDEEWDWRALRDYVVAGIESRFGAIPRDPKKEKGIFDSFVKRWGADAASIARYAFEIADGRWRGSPISITRFCKNADPHFAELIANRLEELRA